MPSRATPAASAARSGWKVSAVLAIACAASDRDEAELGLGHGEGDLELQHGAQLGLEGEMPRNLLVAEQRGEPGMIEDGNAHPGNLPAF